MNPGHLVLPATTPAGSRAHQGPWWAGLPCHWRAHRALRELSEEHECECPVHTHPLPTRVEESMPTHPVATSLPAPCSSTLVPTSCRTSPAGPLLQGHRAARAAGRGTDSEAGSCCCAGRGPRDRRSPRCRRRCTPPQGPAPGTAGGTGPPPGGTALLSGTPCRQGTGLHGEDRAGLSRGHARGPRRWEGVSGAGRGSWGLEETGNRAKSAQGTACPGGRGRCQAKVGGEKVSSPRGRLVEAGRRTGRGHSPVQGCVLQSLVWLWGPWHPGSPGAEAEHPRPRVWTPPLHGAEQADQAAH